MRTKYRQGYSLMPNRADGSGSDENGKQAKDKGQAKDKRNGCSNLEMHTESPDQK